MIETEEDCNKFILENSKGNWIVHIIPVDDGLHSKINTPSVLFIRNILTNKTYYYSFNHIDSRPNILPHEFINNVLLKFDNIKWTIDHKSFVQFIKLSNVYDANLVKYLDSNTILEISDFDTISHQIIRRNSPNYKKSNLAIPLFKHKEAFDDLANFIIKLINNFNIDDAYIKFNDLISTLGNIEEQGIHVDRIKFNDIFNTEPSLSNIVFSQYNVYTSTGRPSNRYGGINYAALSNTDGTRSCFTSRYGKDGRIVVIDYAAFHPRIISSFTNYFVPVNVDFYEYIAKLYFQKKEVDEIDIKNAKQLTFKQLYGGVEDKYSHIKYLANLKFFIDEQWKFFNKNNYILTPIFKRKLTDKHIIDATPTKLFNYILQATEGEIAIPRIKLVMDHLKFKKTKVILYTYDALLFDFHKDDGIETLKTIRDIMSYNGIYPMKTYIGNSYHDVQLINI